MQEDLFGSNRAAEPKKAGRRGARGDVVTGKVRVHDPFELVRWLALSQPGPRKALAELVQKSLDAGAGGAGEGARPVAAGAPLAAGEQDGAVIVGEAEQPSLQNPPEGSPDPIPPPLVGSHDLLAYASEEE